jgi:hypothetical protein
VKYNASNLNQIIKHQILSSFCTQLILLRNLTFSGQYRTPFRFGVQQGFSSIRPSSRPEAKSIIDAAQILVAKMLRKLRPMQNFNIEYVMSVCETA